jgi:oligosaccharyltransferase complex subunit gamma
LCSSLVVGYSLNHRWSKLQEYSSTIDMNSKLFKMLTEEPRNYTLFVLFTTTNQEHNCIACNEFASEYDLIAKSAKKVQGGDSLNFGVLPFANAQDVFQQFEIQNVPRLLRFPPTEG